MAKTTVYLDSSGHVREFSLAVADGQWTGTDATHQAGAPSAAAGSSLAGYGWTVGHSGQVGYLDTAGNVWELSRPVGGQWTGMNLTAHATPAPPRAAARSPLIGCDWVAPQSGAPGGKHVSFLDSAWQVWDASTVAGGQWTAVNVTATAQGIEKTPAAAPGSALSTYQFVSAPEAGFFTVTVQVVYLDTMGHVHELLSIPIAGGLTGWAHMDITEQAGAPPAAAGSPLSGYGWSAGDMKQVVYLDDAGHVWELSAAPGEPWSAADLTQLGGAQPAAAGSPLSGFAWAAGGTKQVVFLDGTGHVHELLLFIPAFAGLGQTTWVDTDLTAQAGADPAAADSPLSGYDWPAANSKQVSYIDTKGHVVELSVAAGAPWSDADLTQLTGAQAPAVGSPVAGYKTLTDLTTLYGLLRARLLSRHFALGRYFRADHLSFRNLLGTVHQAGKQAAYLDAGRHVHQLFLGADGRWAGGGDLTAATGAPAVAAGSRLAGCQWPRGPQFLAYFDEAGHVHSMVAVPGTDGLWGDLDLHQDAIPPAPPAAPGSALAVYPWAGGDADQVAYLDDAGHVHELSAPVGAPWSDADLTQQAGAQPAGPGAPLAGYDWQAGGSKHVAYLDDAGHVHELSFPPGGPWTAADVTAAIVPAPQRAKSDSPLAGYGWPAGRSRHVVYLDGPGHVWELSFPVGGSWTAADLTAAATPKPPAAAAYSPLAAYACALGDSDPPSDSSFDWAAANTRQVVYFDAARHVWELSAEPGGNWVATDLTARTRAPAAAAGSPLSAYAWAGGSAKQVLYLDVHGHVRELSKSAGGDWAHGLQRDLTAQAGAAPAAVAPVSLSGYEWPSPAGNLLEHGYLWDAGGATLIQPAPVYASAAALRTLPAGQSAFERWRVGDRDRANPLMYGGQLMTCLAVETELGIGGSKEILSRQLATTKSLYKYPAPPNDGYILRWDTVTTDHWTTGFFEGGEVVTFDCADFLVDSDRPGGWLYCTPLDDPRYVAYMPQSDFNKLSGNAQNVYQTNRKLSLDRTRYWEPSMDELTGLIAGYSFTATVVTDPDIQAQVTDQVSRLAGYLSANGYLLVRPEGGFTAQGSAGIAPALEFPFSRVFQRLTGDAHPAQVGFEGALANARLWSRFSIPFALATVTGPATGPALLAVLATLVPGLGDLIGLMITEQGGFWAFYQLVGGGGFAKALYLYTAREVFDVYAWPGGPGADSRHDGLQQEFAVAYLLDQFGPVSRFNIALAALSRGIGGFSQNFPPFLGLSAVGDSDHRVADAFLGWLAARRDTTASGDAFASAVAVTLGSGQAEQENLISLLWQKAAYFDETGSDDLDLLDNYLTYDSNITYVTEEVGSTLDFLSALALAWHFAKTQADAGTPLPASLGFPAPPPAGTALPPATLPGAVAAATVGPNPGQILGLPPPPDPIPAEIDLFAATAEHKPPDSPPLTGPLHWVFVYNSTMDHSGNWFGDSGTDTINSGKMLTGSHCVILGVKLQLVNQQGAPLGDEGTSMTPPAAAAVTGGFPSTAGAGIVPGVIYPSTDETVKVRWWYNTGRACRYRIGYLVQGVNCAL